MKQLRFPVLVRLGKLNRKNFQVDLVNIYFVYIYIKFWIKNFFKFKLFHMF
jgi:hypothetical protein